MLPKNLSSKYSQYKNDTDTIASWLAMTAHIYGYKSPTKSKGSKKKGKTPALQSRQTYTIAINDFTALAEFIAAREEPPIEVPSKFTHLLDRAITTREWYSKAISPFLPDDTKKLESDDKHAFFLGILQKVRDILKPRYPKNHSTPKNVPKDMAEVLNMFENLGLEEPSELFEQAPNVSSGGPKAPEVTYKAEDGLEEAFLAFHLLLSDLNELRTEVGRSWEGYKGGLNDLIVASLITNTAVDLARVMEEDLNQLFSKHGGSEKMLPMFYFAQCEQAGTSESFRERPGDELNFGIYNTADAIFWPAFTLLSSFCDVIEGGYIPEMKPGHFGIYDPSTNWFKKDTRARFKDDKILLLELLPEFFALTHAIERTPAEDELTRGLRMMFKTKRVPLWLAYAATLFLDTHHILRDQANSGFKRLKNTTSVVLSSIKNTQDFHKNLTIGNWPRQNDEAMGAFASEIKYWIQEDCHQIQAKRLRRMNIPKPYYFLQNHPWSCGLWKYYIQTNFRELSIIFVNAWGSVMCCEHLYNAVQTEKLLTKSWPDMDLCFALQGPEPFFVGQPPKDAENYLKRFTLAMGGSAANFAAKGSAKKKGMIHSKRHPQSLKELAPVLSTFRERYCAETPRFDLRTEDVEKILEKSEWQYEMDEEDRPVTLFKDDEKVPRTQKAVTKQLAIPKLVVILRAALQAEILELSYDYLTLHRFCWRLLRAIKDSCREALIKIYGPNYIEKETQLPFIVGYILMTATTTDRLAEFMMIKKTNEVTSAVLEQAAVAINGMLGTGAGGFVGMILREKLGLPFEFEEDDE